MLEPRDGDAGALTDRLIQARAERSELTEGRGARSSDGGTARQLVEAFPEDSAPKYILRDRNGIYSEAFARRLERMGMREIRIAPRAPWQNPFVERVIGSIRRECLNHFLIVNERHLRWLLSAYLLYYNTVRPHQALEQNAPRPRQMQPSGLGRVVAIPQVGGLHHRYHRAA